MEQDQSPYLPPDTTVEDRPIEGPSYNREDLPSSPLSLKGLWLLISKPRMFFHFHDWIMRTWEVMFVALLIGMSSVIDRIDTQLFKLDVGRNLPSNFLAVAEGSWGYFWLFVLLSGLLSGVIIWYLGGWWYRIRLGFCGVRDADPYVARCTYAYQAFVQSGPHLLLIGMAAFFHSNYLEHWASEEWVDILPSILLMVLVLYSCFISYCGALSFLPQRKPAMVWFLILPVIFYIMAFGGASYLYMTLAV